jgi:hypothetical protein
MRANGKHAMGRFAVDFEVANNEDIVRARNGDLDPAKVRRTTISGVVDPGATRLVLPLAVVKELGLPIKKKKSGFAMPRDGGRCVPRPSRLRSRCKDATTFSARPSNRGARPP